MASKFIGCIISADTGELYAVINPDNDYELDNPRWLLMRGLATDAIRLIKVPREQYEAHTSMDPVMEIVRGLANL